MRLPLTFILLAGCGSSAPAPDGSIECTTADPRADTFVVGLDKHGPAGALDFQLMSATPAPPARGDNAWILQLNAMSAGVIGSPVSGATMMVTPFMPDHQHGTPIPVVVTPMATAGQYKVSPVNMWMPGYWETTIQAVNGPSSDAAVFKFCIPN